MKDFLGREIKVGDWLVCGRRDGNTSVTVLYKVLEVDGGVKAIGFANKWNPTNLEKNSRPSFPNPATSVIVPDADVPQYVKDML